MTQRIALTPGEPSGIGPDLAVLLAQEDRDYELIAIADPEMLRRRAALLGQTLQLEQVDLSRPPVPAKAGTLLYQPILLTCEEQAGIPDPENSRYVLDTLDEAIRGCLEQDYAALVTGPIHKGVINDAGIPFTGHTEYLAEKSGGHHPVMMLATEQLRVALATTHLPLAEVPAAVTPQRLERVLSILHRELQQHFGRTAPRILVSGLNPHAGEDGHLGREEIEVIEPVLQHLRQEGMDLVGPLPADTLFTPRYLDHADAVLAMYHDQGLPVLKYSGFGRAVNITLGLPLIRTSVDHGTACELAGTGKIDTGSLKTAIATALDMVRHTSS